MLWFIGLIVSLWGLRLSDPLIAGDSPGKVRQRVGVIAKYCAVIFAGATIVAFSIGGELMGREEAQQRAEITTIAIQKTDFDTCSDNELQIIAQEVARVNDAILLHKKYDTALLILLGEEKYESYDMMIEIQDQRLAEEVNKYSNREKVKTKWKKVTYKGDTPIEIDGEEIG